MQGRDYQFLLTWMPKFKEQFLRHAFFFVFLLLLLFFFVFFMFISAVGLLFQLKLFIWPKNKSVYGSL